MVENEYLILVNPVSGTGRAPKFVEENVIPLLRSLGLPYRMWMTTSVTEGNDAGGLGRLIMDTTEAAESQPLHFIVAAGDGTAHELMHGILGGKGALRKWEIVVLPMGTANALHSTLFPPGSPPVPVPPHLESHLPSDPEVRHALSSLTLALSGGDTKPTRHPITLTRLRDASGAEVRTVSQPIPSHVVLSTSLHATILADSEALRFSIPGLERFKHAAAANIGVSFPAVVKLLPGPDGVKQYSPSSQTWVAPFTADKVDEGAVELNGPFAYFLSATTTPRLEPTFVILPTLKNPGRGTMDIVILRPARDPAYRAAVAAGRSGSKEQAARSMQALRAAYEDGRHVRFVFPPGGEGDAVDATSSENDRDVVVETFRCRGFTWTPTDASHAKSHIVCADGSLYTIPQGGSAEASVMGDGVEDGFWVWGP